jgi:hypothetical protein
MTEIKQRTAGSEGQAMRLDSSGSAAGECGGSTGGLIAAAVRRGGARARENAVPRCTGVSDWAAWRADGGRRAGVASAQNTRIRGSFSNAASEAASVAESVVASGEENGKESVADSLVRSRRMRRCARCILVCCRWASSHSAMRAWMSISINSSRISIICLRRFARSFRRASSNDCNEVFEQVARYSSIGLVVFMPRVSQGHKFPGSGWGTRGYMPYLTSR